MSELRSEEEQLELIRNWFKENGKSLLVGVLIALIAVFGWEGWKRYQSSYNGAASALYQTMLQGMNVLKSGKIGDDQKATLVHTAQQLRDEYGDTSYAHFGGLLLAKLYVETGELGKAEEQLRWVHEQERNTDMGELAQLRLARVLAADGKGEEALGLLQEQPGAYEADRAELRGDILVSLGKKAEARDAYTTAVALYQEAGRPSPALAMKLDDLAVAKGS
ncbi:YfgM family protein [Pokkaliibacter sp. CJK22405]|uniref:YfgM family protein n=1 Tax=Pokkaliibacter sp. CJK22405 TaxID=3384615 RepID=UPI003985688B